MTDKQRLIFGPPTVMWRDPDGTIHTETITSRERMAEWTAEREAEELDDEDDAYEEYLERCERSFMGLDEF